MTASPVVYDFIIYQGATFSQLITYTDSSNVAVDLSGYTASMQVRNRKSSSTSLADFTTENGRITLNSSGEILITMSATDTAALTSCGGVYDLELTETSSGAVIRLLEGQMAFNLDVTRT